MQMELGRSAKRQEKCREAQGKCRERSFLIAPTWAWSKNGKMVKVAERRLISVRAIPLGKNINNFKYIEYSFLLL